MYGRVWESICKKVRLGRGVKGRSGRGVRVLVNRLFGECTRAVEGGWVGVG